MRRIGIPAHLLIVLLVPVVTGFFSDLHAQSDNEPIIIGSHRTIDSRILDEQRLLYVHLPEDYEDSDQLYPVVFQLYAHFQGSYFLPQVRALDVMALHGKCPQMILVGLETNQGRYRDLLPADHFGATSEIDQFLAFFESELVPFVEKNYRAGGYRILSGPQAGAAFGLYVLSKRPELFRALFLSNPFWVERARQPLRDVFELALEEGRFENHTLVISYEADESDGARMALGDFSEELNERRPAGLDFLLNPLPANYDYAVSTDIETGIQRIFEGFELPREGEPLSISEIERRYSQLESRLGFEMKPAELGLVQQGDKYMERGDTEHAVAMFEYVLERYPESLMCFVRLGDYYATRGDKGLAREYYEDFQKILPDSPFIQSKIDGLDDG